VLRLWLISAVAAAACVEKTPEGKKIDPAYVQENLLSEAPALQNEVNADLGGKVLYLGNDVDTASLAPGGEVRVVHYWKVLDPPGSDWRVFSHVTGDGGEWMNVDYTDMRQGHPPSKWSAGEIIRDEQRFALKGSWKSKHASLTVGLYRKGVSGIDGRMPIVDGPKDQEERVPAFRFTVDVKNAPAAAASKDYTIRRASGPIVIDGVADEDAWKTAPRSPNFSDAESGPAVGYATRARLLWDDDHLYAFIEVEDADIFSPFSGRDDTLWKADVVELFIDADRNRRGYVELQVNPNNAIFDAWFPRTRAQKHHFEWNSSMKTAVTLHGTNDDRSDKDKGWDVEIAIPIADVKGMDEAMAINAPPQVGDKWRLNVVRVEAPKGKNSVSASSWNPITIQDFHALGRMLIVVFGDETGSAAPKAGDPGDGDATDPASASADGGAAGASEDAAPSKASETAPKPTPKSAPALSPTSPTKTPAKSPKPTPAPETP
jgi:hypothetical protein